jgi:membrane associated rhomboid family serine protease
MVGMERYRDLVNAIFFGLSMLGGAFMGFCVWGGHISHGPEEHVWWYVQGAIGGAIAGGLLWKLLAAFARTEIERRDPPIVG